MDLRRRFEGLGEQYERFRPTYPTAMIDWLLALAHPARAVDLGCGTGIAMRMISARGVAVVGVDPSADMLRQAAGARVRADAMQLPFGKAAFDLAYAAQSFHWFDVDVALAEIARVVAPGGWACAFWNLRAQTAFHAEYEQLLRTFSTEYAGLQRRGRDSLPALLAHVEARRESFPNPRRLTLLELVGYAHSSSYVAHGVADPAAFDAALADLHHRHAHGNTVDFDWETVAVAWQPG